MDQTAGPLLVLADTFVMACDYADEHGLGRVGGRWLYVRDARTAYGRNGPGRYVVVTVPGARLAPGRAADRLDALRYLRSRGFVSAS